MDECNYLIKEHQENSFEEFLQNERLAKAICRSLEIIGEASSKINPDLKIRFPEINWREMRFKKQNYPPLFRNRL